MKEDELDKWSEVMEKLLSRLYDELTVGERNKYFITTTVSLKEGIINLLIELDGESNDR